MTPDERDRLIDQILSNQRDLQESDLRQSERLSSLERSVEDLTMSVRELVGVAGTQQESIGALIQSHQLLTRHTDQLTQQTEQMKRALDYLLSKDGGNGSSS